MKKIALLLFVFSALFAQQLSAQVDRNIGRSYAKPKKKKDTTDYLELTVQKLGETLSLDSFQQAIVKDLLKSNQAEQEKIIMLEIPTESKEEKILELHEKFNAKLVAILTPEQAKQFEELQSKSKKKK